jgi:hypothetical protein
MPGRRRPDRLARTLPALGAACLLLVLLTPTVRAASANVTIGPSGSVDLSLSASIPNGSAVREAMDGNFTPIVEAITPNATEQATILRDIASAESTPILGSLFGNRDGTVEPNEVASFESLLQYEAQLLPTGSISGGSLLAFTLDGGRATSTQISGIAFSNATGPSDSTAPIGVTTRLNYTFAESGSSHTLALTANLSTGGFPVALLTGTVDLTVTTPAGTSITGTEGFSQSTTSNDPLGWGTSSVSGSFAPTTSGSLSVSFGPAFPTGDLAIAAPFIAFAALLAVLLLVRRRRRKAAAA